VERAERIGVILCRTAADVPNGQLPDDCIVMNMLGGTAPSTIMTRGNVGKSPAEIPIDQKKLVRGILTRATADGTFVTAQLDTGHFVTASSNKAGIDLLQQATSLVTIH
jgi:hypothetical protein